MTVLVGVLCKDGVVVGSDGSATFGAGRNLATIEQPVRKTFVIAPDLIFTTTGAGGLGQRLEFILRAMRPQLTEWHELPHLEIALRISRTMLDNMRTTYLSPGQLGALVAYTCQNAFHLCEFAVADFQPEMKTADAWFVSMGSGQMITDPFFGFLRRSLFRAAQPTLDEGVLAAYWALHNAIELNTGGINKPIQLAILRRPTPDAPFEARLLSEAELDEHRDAVDRIEADLAAYRQQLLSQASPPIPQPPLPPGPPSAPDTGGAFPQNG